MKKTLLDYITGCVTPAEARRFQVALGADPNRFLRQVQRHYKKKDDKGIGNAFDKLTRKLFGIEKSPLDMSPEEIQRFTNVVQDREDMAALDVNLTSDLFASGSVPKDITTKVQRVIQNFYLGSQNGVPNRTFFESPRDLMLMPQTDRTKPPVLHIRTRKRIAQKFLELIGINREKIKEILSGKENEGVKHLGHKYTVQFSSVSDLTQLGSLNKADFDKFAQVANKFLAKRGGGKVVVHNEQTPKDAYFEFTGNLELLEDIFHRTLRGENFWPVKFDTMSRINTVLDKLKTDYKA